MDKWIIIFFFQGLFVCFFSPNFFSLGNQFDDDVDVYNNDYKFHLFFACKMYIKKSRISLVTKTPYTYK